MVFETGAISTLEVKELHNSDPHMVKKSWMTPHTPFLTVENSIRFGHSSAKVGIYICTFPNLNVSSNQRSRQGE